MPSAPSSGSGAQPPPQDLADSILAEVATAILDPDEAELLKEQQTVHAGNAQQAKVWREILKEQGHTEPMEKKPKKLPRVPNQLDFKEAHAFLPPKAVMYEDTSEGRVRLFMTAHGQRKSRGRTTQAMPMYEILKTLLITAWGWHNDATGEVCHWVAFR